MGRQKKNKPRRERSEMSVRLVSTIEEVLSAAAALATSRTDALVMVAPLPLDLGYHIEAFPQQSDLMWRVIELEDVDTEAYIVFSERTATNAAKRGYNLMDGVESYMDMLDKVTLQTVKAVPFIPSRMAPRWRAMAEERGVPPERP